MSRRAAAAALSLGLLVTGCGGSGGKHRPSRPGTTSAVTVAAVRPPVPGRPAVAAHASVAHTPAGTLVAHTAPTVQALVTDEQQNRVLVVDLPSGRVVRRLAMPPDPEDVAADSGECSSVVVTSATAGKVTVLDRETLHRRA